MLSVSRKELADSSKSRFAVARTSTLKSKRQLMDIKKRGYCDGNDQRERNIRFCQARL